MYQHPTINITLNNYPFAMKNMVGTHAVSIPYQSIKQWFIDRKHVQCKISAKYQSSCFQNTICETIGPEKVVKAFSVFFFFSHVKSNLIILISLFGHICTCIVFHNHFHKICLLRLKSFKVSRCLIMTLIWQMKSFVKYFI